MCVLLFFTIIFTVFFSTRKTEKSFNFFITMWRLHTYKSMRITSVTQELSIQSLFSAQVCSHSSLDQTQIRTYTVSLIDCEQQQKFSLFKTYFMSNKRQSTKCSHREVNFSCQSKPISVCVFYMTRFNLRTTATKQQRNL